MFFNRKELERNCPIGINDYFLKPIFSYRATLCFGANTVGLCGPMFTTKAELNVHVCPIMLHTCMTLSC